jgi:hypothetical protein
MDYIHGEMVTISLERYDELKKLENIVQQKQEHISELIGMHTDIHNKVEELGIEIIYEETDKPGYSSINLPKSIEAAFNKLKAQVK